MRHKLFNSDAELAGYLNESAGPGRPSVIVLHEWWGVTPQIRNFADRLASEGFIAFAMDLFHGKIASDAAEAEGFVKALDWKRVGSEIQDVVEALKARDPRTAIGVLGFCLGGAASLYAAAIIPEIKACVPFYGIYPCADLTRIKARVLAHFAIDDPWNPTEKVDELERTLKTGGISLEMHRYDASHAFFNESRPEVYSARDAALAWERTLKFLKATLD